MLGQTASSKMDSLVYTMNNPGYATVTRPEKEGCD